MYLFEKAARILWNDLNISFGDIPLTREAEGLLDDRRQKALQAITEMWPALARVWIYESDRQLTSACSRVAFNIIDAREDFSRQASSVKLALDKLLVVLLDSSASHEARSTAHTAFGESIQEYDKAMKPHMDAIQHGFLDLLGALRAYLASKGKTLPPVPDHFN